MDPWSLADQLSLVVVRELLPARYRAVYAGGHPPIILVQRGLRRTEEREALLEEVGHHLFTRADVLQWLLDPLRWLLAAKEERWIRQWRASKLLRHQRLGPPLKEALANDNERWEAWTEELGVTPDPLREYMAWWVARRRQQRQQRERRTRCTG